MEMVGTNKKNEFARKIFKLSKLVNEFQKEDKPVLTVRDAILVILYAQKDKPIYSRTMLFKEIFLLYKEIIEKYRDSFIIQNPKFFGFKFGPYSFELAEAIKQLYWSGFINIEGKPNTKREKFELTPKGLKETKKIFETLPKNVQDEIREMRIGWDQLGIDGILRYVYAKYPEYTDKSKIKDKYKWIIWGGKG